MSGDTVAIIGSGGNIGSHVAVHVARMRTVNRVVLVDPDVYEASNLHSQHTEACDLGKPKVLVQRRALARINPALVIEAIKAPVGLVPMGRLQADVIMTGLDSRRARLDVNRIAWRLQIPWVDAGVDADRLLARVTSYSPGSGTPCMECGFGDDDYAALEQVHPCRHGSAPATGAPSYLGALAASLAVVECDRILEGRDDGAAMSQQLVIDASFRRCLTTRFQRQASCRFDHECWDIHRLDARSEGFSFADLIRAGGRGNRLDECKIELEGHLFITGLTCRECARARALVRLAGRLSRADRRCRHCGGEMLPSVLDQSDAIGPRMRVFRRLANRTLRSAGIRSGDVLTVWNADEATRFELE